MTVAEVRAAAEERVLELVNTGQQDPMDLVARLRTEGFDDLAIREAIWRLIDRSEITLTSQRTLATNPGQPAQ
jgi:hypothetical protein